MQIQSNAFEECRNLEKVVFKGAPAATADFIFFGDAFKGTAITEVKFETALIAPTFSGNSFTGITGCKLIYPCAAAVGTATGEFPAEGTGKA